MYACVSMEVDICVYMYVCESGCDIPLSCQVLRTRFACVSGEPWSHALHSVMPHLSGEGPVPYIQRKWNYIRMSHTGKFSAWCLLSPVQVAWTHIETSSLCITSFIALSKMSGSHFLTLTFFFPLLPTYPMYSYYLSISCQSTA